jgi:hypothetical protein
MVGIKKNQNELRGMLRTVEVDVNKGVCNALAVNLKGKMIKKHSKSKSKDMGNVNAQVVTSSASKPKDVLIIEVNLATFISDWVLDTDFYTYICSNMQTLRNKKLLGKCEMLLQVGNGASVVVAVVGDLDLHLPSGLILELSSVYFVPSIFRNIISILCMDMDDFTFSIKDQCFSFYRDCIFYDNSHIVNDLYVLEIENYVLNINNKRLKSSHESETLI